MLPLPSLLSPVVLVLLPLMGLAVCAWAAIRLYRRHLRLSPLRRILATDLVLVEQAIAEVSGDASKETYIRIAIAAQLRQLTELYLKTDRLRYLLGSIYLIAGFVSIGITGTDAYIPGYVNTVKFSFAVNIIGEIASGFLIFGGFESKSAVSFKLAGLIRHETIQFVGQSAEYFGAAASERWRLFTTSVDALTLEAISPTPAPSRKETDDAESDNLDA
jgi:hypothetical protein